MECVVLLHYVLAITLISVLARPTDTKNGDHQRQSEEPYNVNHNGGTQLQPWQPIGKNMFPTPILGVGNEIVMKGQITDNSVSIHFNNNNGQEVCKILVEPENSIIVFINGTEVHSSATNEYLNGKQQYVFRFQMHPTQDNSMMIHLSTASVNDPQHLVSVPIDVPSIRMITASGQVDTLTFIFKKDALF